MIVAAQLAALALVDVLLSGFRAAAGREGRIVKVPFYCAALARAAAAGVILVAANTAIVGAIVASAPEPTAAWQALVEAGARSVSVFAVFATLAMAAILFWFSRFPDVRIVPTLLVLGPLTLVRPLVIGGGLLYAAWPAADWRVWAAALVAGVSMLGVETILGLRYRNRWRYLV
jgi:hypothetical protein